MSDRAARRRFPWLRLALLIALALFWWERPDVASHVPASWHPWAPLDLRAPPDRWTRTRLARLDHDPLACLDALTQASGVFRVLPDRDLGDGCGQRNAVSVRRLSVRVEPFVLSCRAAVSLALWDRHVLQPAAEKYLGARVGRIEHFGSYACRNIGSGPQGRRSQHATADALDVAGVVLENGRRVRVANAWRAGNETSAFVREIRDGACGVFDAVLGPDYNAAHRDHLHLDRGAFRACR